MRLLKFVTPRRKRITYQVFFRIGGDSIEMLKPEQRQYKPGIIRLWPLRFAFRDEDLTKEQFVGQLRMQLAAHGLVVGPEQIRFPSFNSRGLHTTRSCHVEIPVGTDLPPGLTTVIGRLRPKMHTSVIEHERIPEVGSF